MPHLNGGYDFVDRITPRDAGRTALDFLSAKYPRDTRELWQERIAAGRILLDGIVLTDERPLSAGTLLIWRRPPWFEPDVPLDFEVLYEDEHLLAVCKPAGLPTTAGGGVFLDHTLARQLILRGYDAAPAHRLDRGTSGVVVCGKTVEARRQIGAAWERGDVKKTYRARIQGAFRHDHLEIDIPIGKVPHPLLGEVFATQASGKASTSIVHLIRVGADESLVDVDLITGRPHQIRIHLAAVGHPLVGEPFYGTGGVPRTDVRALPGDEGFQLHALCVTLPHPKTGIDVTIRAEPTEQFYSTMTAVEPSAQTPPSSTRSTT